MIRTVEQLKCHMRMCANLEVLNYRGTDPMVIFDTHTPQDPARIDPAVFAEALAAGVLIRHPELMHVPDRYAYNWRSDPLLNHAEETAS